MKKKEKQYILSLFLEQNESDYDMVHFAKEAFGFTVYYTESKVTQYKSMFEALTRSQMQKAVQFIALLDSLRREAKLCNLSQLLMQILTKKCRL